MSGAVALRRPAVIETDPASSFVCDYVAGVNRVLSFPPYLLVDNIGRFVRGEELLNRVDKRRWF